MIKKVNLIRCLDANNLYGWEMSKYLPYGGFKRLTLEEIKKKKKK